MATYHFSQSFRYRIRRDIPLSQLHNLTHPGFLRIRPEEHHHGIRGTINHDPALAGLFKLFFFVRYIYSYSLSFHAVPDGTEPDREKEDGGFRCKRSRKRRCKHSILPLAFPVTIRKF